MDCTFPIDNWVDFSKRQDQVPGLRAEDLPPVMLEDDPRISSLSRHSKCSERTCHPLSSTLAFKNGCTKRESDFLALAGQDIAIPLVSRIGRIDNNFALFEQTAAITERGTPFLVSDIAPEKRRDTSLRVVDLVSRLHAQGIVHGDIHPGVLQWNARGQLVFADFANARWADGDEFHRKIPNWDGNEDFISPRLRTQTRPGRCVCPDKEEDLYSMAVTVWCIWAGRSPDPGMFSQGSSGPVPDIGLITDPSMNASVSDILRSGGLDIDSSSPPHPLKDPDCSPAHSKDTRVPGPELEKLDKKPRRNTWDGQMVPIAAETIQLLASDALSFEELLAGPGEYAGEDDIDLQSDDGSDEDDELDEEITWEFPFPYLQGLTATPTESVICLASPKDPTFLPSSTIFVTPEQLKHRLPPLEEFGVHCHERHLPHHRPSHSVPSSDLERLIHGHNSLLSHVDLRTYVSKVLSPRL